MRTLAALWLALSALVPASLAVAQEPSVPPVMVVVLRSGHVDDALEIAVQTALVDGVTPLAVGRPVLPLAQAELRDRLAACADAACRGAFVAELGAVGAIVVQLSRTSTRGSVQLTLDALDPVSGATRLPQLSASLASEPTEVAATLAPLLEQLRPVMFSPPPAPPTLLVTVNVDGAIVTIDDAAVGHTPIAAQRLTVGPHVVRVTHDGYAGTQRALDLAAGEQARIDINLAILEGAALEASMPVDGGVAAEPQWYEQWYVWVGVAAGVLVIAGIVIGAVVASQPTPHPDPMGIPLPGLRF